jgi:hypothetical protein
VIRLLLLLVGDDEDDGGVDEIGVDGSVSSLLVLLSLHRMI